MVSCLALFFFFKQKTAYEVVSRDWSSDVCSSDLLVTNNAAPLGTENMRYVERDQIGPINNFTD